MTSGGAATVGPLTGIPTSIIIAPTPRTKRMARKRFQLGVLISGGGRTLCNLHERIAGGELDAEIAVAVCSRPNAAGVERARACGIETVIVDRRAVGDVEFHDRVTRAVGEVDLVCLAGFLSLWRFPPRRFGRVINIHPALLPDFGGPGMYGRRVHEAVLASGATQSGCTVHLCDDHYDTGPILLQRRVAVQPSDTVESLAARVFEQECIAYPEAIRLFIEDRVEVRGRGVTVRRG